MTPRGNPDSVNGYVDTIERMERDIHPVDDSAFYASASISLRRAADYQMYSLCVICLAAGALCIIAGTLLYLVYLARTV